MKILFLTPRDSRKNLGGVEGHVRILTEELERRGNEVKELSLKDQDNTSIASLDSSTRRKLLARNDVFFKFRAWKYLWDRRELLRWAEVIHVHDVFWWLLPYVLLNRLGLICGSFNLLNKVAERDTNDTNRHPNDTNKKSVFVTFHGWEGVCPPSWSAVWQKRLAQKLSRGTIGVGSFYEKWYGIKPDRIVWGVMSPEINKGPAFRLAKGQALRKIAFLGRLEEVNGVEILLETMDKYYKSYKSYKNRGIKIIFIGDGSYRKQAEKFGKVTGMVKNPQKYLVDADVVITSSYMSMLEAAAMWKPIIAIANSELKMDYLKGHPLRKWIKVVKDSDELIKIIRGVYEGLALREQQGQALGTGKAMSWARKQTPERLADIYEELWG